MLDLPIRNGLIIDGTGSPGYYGTHTGALPGRALKHGRPST